MTVVYHHTKYGWMWVVECEIHAAYSRVYYTRRSSAKRGFERFVRHISGKGKAP